MDENINGEVVEHVVVDGHPYGLVVRTCWQMDGSDRLRYPSRLYEHRTKANAITRRHPGQDVNAFNQEMWMDLEDFFKGFCKMLPRKCNQPTVPDLIALLANDNKCRFEFKCIARLQKATHLGMTFWPFKIRAAQGHTMRSMKKADASGTFNATMVYARTGAEAVTKASVTGKP